MKILILTHRVPFPQNGGYPIVVCNTIRGLVNMGYEISLLSLKDKKHRHEEEESDELLSKISYRYYEIDTSMSLVDGFLTTFNKKAYNIDRYYNQNFERLLINEVIDGKYDIIQFEGLFVSPYIDSVRRNCRSKLIYRAHNIEHQIWERLAQQKSDPFKKIYLRLMSRRIKKYETERINKFDAIAVFTAQDKSTLLLYGAKIPVEVVPVGVEMSHYKPDFSKTEFPSLFFLGSLDWTPNREGIEWFLHAFHNDIANDDLRVKFYVAGNDIPEEFDEYEVLGKIFIQGEVDNALEFVNSKSIMIVPLLSGGGMRVKIVEGMAMQKCIISTSLGAEGINYKNGVNILIANTREEFFKAIRRCIADEDYCKAVGINARRLIEDQHDVDKVTNNLVNLYRASL
ncbi:glycosyltransferase family 4 protein [Mucilaginibacter ginsenosidivorans]|uniref:Glycosyltransferase family 4 protein n=1 Tax=Mucilaginibacter ginsenosidivorans TaxID=398053 RepID=A0A5B8URT5_9SPHI|nr:glycosyltransferase family 4 protein [Mucilaginibacter ginsenosidivorans]QEC61787.1 glycosyltransferase family 4 protein [Mucilaginibacter ginsenosidivorans]